MNHKILKLKLKIYELILNQFSLSYYMYNRILIIYMM
jgi:hypothetical protein